MDIKLVQKILVDLFKIDSYKYGKAQVLTFACDSNRYIDYEGKKYSPLINTVEDSLAQQNVSCISITRIASRIKGGLSHGHVFSPEGAFARALVLKRLKGLLLRKGQYPYSYYEEKIWEKILKKTEVKAVIGINPSRELCTVCHRNGIWVADLQHGVISDAHPWYGASFRSKDARERLPDAFLCWDMASVEVINKWAEKTDIEVLPIGNPWVERFIRKNSSDKLYNLLRNQYGIAGNNKLTILISLSWGSYNISNKFIHPELEKFILDNIDNYNWMMRLHPNQLQGFATDSGVNFFKYFESTYPVEMIDWEQATKMPLPLLLSEVDLHISWNSSVCMEAAFLGVKSLLMDPELLPGGTKEKNYQRLVNEGYVKKIHANYTDIKDWVQGNSNSAMPFYQSYFLSYMRLIEKVAERVKP